MDNRNVRNGDPIPVSNYSDQPYVVKTDDGGWLMVVTTGVGTEGSKGQHIASAKSFDCGKTWSEPVCVESPENPESSYAVIYKTSYGRVYCFYNYNAENRRFVLGDPDYTANDSHSVDTGASFSLLLTADFDKPGVLFSTMTQEHRGMEAAFDGEKIVFTLGDGRRTNVFYSDKAPLAAKGVHTVVVQVDAGSRVVSMMIDRKVCDGADERQFGYGWFDRSLLHANGNQTAFVGEQVCLAELFPNGLTNSEAFWL